MNESMRELQKVLAGRVQELSKKLDTVTTAKQAAAIVQEMQEFNHRVTLTGQLLFKAQSAELTKSVEKVSEARARVDGAIQKIGKLAKALTVISDFLALVDEAIDLAKAVG